MGEEAPTRRIILQAAQLVSASSLFTRIAFIIQLHPTPPVTMSGHLPKVSCSSGLDSGHLAALAACWPEHPSLTYKLNNPQTVKEVNTEHPCKHPPPNTLSPIALRYTPSWSSP